LPENGVRKCFVGPWVFRSGNVVLPFTSNQIRFLEAYFFDS